MQTAAWLGLSSSGERVAGQPQHHRSRRCHLQPAAARAGKTLYTVAGQQQQRQSHIWGHMGAAQPQAWKAGHAASGRRSGKHMGSGALVPLNYSVCLALPYMRCIKTTACLGVRRRFKKGSRFKGRDRGSQSAGRSSKLEGLRSRQEGASSHCREQAEHSSKLNERLTNRSNKGTAQTTGSSRTEQGGGDGSHHRVQAERSSMSWTAHAQSKGGGSAGAPKLNGLTIRAT